MVLADLLDGLLQVSEAQGAAARAGDWDAVLRYDGVRITLLTRLQGAATPGDAPAVAACLTAAHAMSRNVEAAFADGRRAFAADLAKLAAHDRVARAYAPTPVR